MPSSDETSWSSGSGFEEAASSAQGAEGLVGACAHRTAALPGIGICVPDIPVGARCPHTDSPVQPVPRYRCHLPFPRGEVDLHQADVH